MALRLRVSYVNGEITDAVVSPMAQVAAERHFKGKLDDHRVEASYFLAWYTLHRSGNEAADFEPFLDSITEVVDADDIENNGDDGDAIEGPTPSTP